MLSFRVVSINRRVLRSEYQISDDKSAELDICRGLRSCGSVGARSSPVCDEASGPNRSKVFASQLPKEAKQRNDQDKGDRELSAETLNTASALLRRFAR